MPDSTIPTCPVCARLMKRPRALYGQSLCRSCYVGFANRRQIAFFIDLVIWTLILVLPPVILGVQQEAQGQSAIAFLVFPLFYVTGRFGIAMASFPIFALKDGFAGSSPGKAMLDLQVIESTSGRPIGFAESLRRNLPLALPFVPILVAGRVLYGERIGDRGANTRVIWKRHRGKGPFAFAVSHG